jgi:hypothetical protein
VSDHVCGGDTVLFWNGVCMCVCSVVWCHVLTMMYCMHVCDEMVCFMTMHVLCTI